MIRLCLLASPGIVASAQAATPLEQFGRDSLASNFAIAALLSDDEVMRLGFWNFDPNELLGTDNDNLGNEQSLGVRESLKQFSLPWRWALSHETDTEHLWLLTKLAYLDVEQESRLVFESQEAEDDIDQQVYSAWAGLGYRRDLGEHWQVQLETNLAWMRLRNRVKFNSPESRLLAPLLDGVITNYHAEAILLEPGLGLYYRWASRGYRWRLFSRYRYLTGSSINPDSAAQEVKPEASYWSNGIGLRKPLAFADSNGAHSLWLRLARVDVSGDLSRQLENSHYLELGIGWLMDTGDRFALLDNVGIGIDFNYGSELRGGTLMLMFNVDEF